MSGASHRSIERRSWTVTGIVMAKPHLMTSNGFVGNRTVNASRGIWL